ncbi:MAG: transglutaminaseTgpA domain-containing protein [Caldilineaceae bacterium]
MAASLDAAGYVPSMGLLIPVTFGALAMSLLMAYSRFDSFFAFSHGMFTGLAWILYLMAGLVTAEENRSFLEFGFPELQANVYFVLYRLLNWTESAFGGQAKADNYMFVFEISFLVWWLTYLGVWSIFRHGYTWRAIIPAGVVLLINTYYAPQSILVFLVFFAFIAIILLVRTNLAEQQVRWRSQRTYFSQDISLDFMRTGFNYALLVLLLAWLAPGLGRNPVVRDWLRGPTEAWTDFSQRVDELYDLNTRRVPTTSAFGNTLNLGGERNVGDNIIFTVNTTRGRYWRAVVFDTFDGRQWQNTTAAEENFDAEVPLPVADWQLREPVTQTVTILAPTGDVVFGAPDIYLTDLPLEAQVQPVDAAVITGAAVDAGETPLPVEFTFIRSRHTLDVNATYTVVSRQTVVTEKALMEAGTEYPQSIVNTYLQLPEDFSPNVAALAQEMISSTISQTAALPTVYEQVKVIEQYLRTIPYNDAIPAPPADRDPVEYFLFELQEGYCDYYATAMALMLRSLGIPARVASGYAEGNFDEESRLFFVTERDAHTWVEVYFPNYGWIEFEPTAGESLLSRPSGAEEPIDEGNFADTISGNGETNGPDDLPPDITDPSFNDFPEDFGGFDGGGGIGSWPWQLWAILTPILLILGIVGLRFVPGFRAPAYTADLPPILYGRLQRWMGRLGIRLAETETPYEQSRRLGYALPEGQSLIQQIVHQYVLHRFSGMAATGSSSLPDSSAAAPGATGTMLGQAWQRLEPIFWKAWLRRFYYTKIRRRSNPFVLRKE